MVVTSSFGSGNGHLVVGLKFTSYHKSSINENSGRLNPHCPSFKIVRSCSEGESRKLRLRHGSLGHQRRADPALRGASGARDDRKRSGVGGATVTLWCF